jgi:hypothetical protein
MPLTEISPPAFPLCQRLRGVWRGRSLRTSSRVGCWLPACGALRITARGRRLDSRGPFACMLLDDMHANLGLSKRPHCLVCFVLVAAFRAIFIIFHVGAKGQYIRAAPIPFASSRL